MIVLSVSNVVPALALPRDFATLASLECFQTRVNAARVRRAQVTWKLRHLTLGQRVGHDVIPRAKLDITRVSCYNSYR